MIDIMKQFLYALVNFDKCDFNLFTARNGTSSAVGAFGGAFYESNEIFLNADVAVNQITFSYISEIAIAAFIGLVVTFLGRKLMTALWDNVVTTLWERLKKKIFKPK